MCPPSSLQVIDCLQTFKLIAEMGGESLGAYVISMAKRPSDVLAVKLLMKEFGLKRSVRRHEEMREWENEVKSRSQSTPKGLAQSDATHVMRT